MSALDAWLTARSNSDTSCVVVDHLFYICAVERLSGEFLKPADKVLLFRLQIRRQRKPRFDANCCNFWPSWLWSVAICSPNCLTSLLDAFCAAMLPS